MPGVAEHDLWPMVLSGNAVDVTELAAAIETEILQGGELDFRTRLLIRDASDVLAELRGNSWLDNWLTMSPSGSTIREIRKADLGPPGFSLLRRRVMDTTKPDVVMSFLRELGSACPVLTRIEIGGAIAAILAGTLLRRTEDIDIVNEVPATIRNEHELLRQLAERFGLRLAHFQSHYLPDEWAKRLRSLGRIGNLDVFLIDPLDIFVGKLFSPRVKDRDDLRAMAGRLEKSELGARLLQAGGTLRSETRLAKYAADNWYIIYGDALPT